MRVLQPRNQGVRKSKGAKFAAGLVVGLAIARVIRSRRDSLRNISFPSASLRDTPFGFMSSLAAGGWRWGTNARDRARGVRPSRLRRLLAERRELNDMEGRVLGAFLADEVLGERAIDIGAISPGIIELTGTVFNEDEVERAVRVARTVTDVSTVVNRLATSDTSTRPARGQDGRPSFSTPEGRVGGMGRRRQSLETDPDQPDDSRKLREEALAAADRDQWEDEGLLAANGTFGEEGPDPAEVNFSEDELDNQDPRRGEWR